MNFEWSTMELKLSPLRTRMVYNGAETSLDCRDLYLRNNKCEDLMHGVGILTTAHHRLWRICHNHCHSLCSYCCGGRFAALYATLFTPHQWPTCPHKLIGSQYPDKSMIGQKSAPIKIWSKYSAQINNELFFSLKLIIDN